MKPIHPITRNTLTRCLLAGLIFVLMMACNMPSGAATDPNTAAAAAATVAALVGQTQTAAAPSAVTPAAGLTAAVTQTQPAADTDTPAPGVTPLNPGVNPPTATTAAGFQPTATTAAVIAPTATTAPPLQPSDTPFILPPGGLKLIPTATSTLGLILPPKVIGTAILPSLLPTLISVPGGHSMVTTSGNVASGGVVIYSFNASSGQPVALSLKSDLGDVTFSLTGSNTGKVLVPPSAKSNYWRSEVPKTDTYLVRVFGGSGTENFTLRMTMPLWANYAKSKTTYTNGTTPSGEPLGYMISGSQGDTLSLAIKATNPNVVLYVTGWDSGDIYLSDMAGQQTFSGFVMPSSQNYLVMMVPKAPGAQAFSLQIRIQ